MSKTKDVNLYKKLRVLKRDIRHILDCIDEVHYPELTEHLKEMNMVLDENIRNLKQNTLDN